MQVNTGLLGLHLAVVLLGMTALFGKFLSLSPIAIIAGRSLIAAACIYIFLQYMRVDMDVASKRHRVVLVLSGFLLAVHWFTFFYSIQLSTVAIGVIGFSTYPVFVTLMEPVLFSETLRMRDVLSGLLVCIGLLVLAPDFDLTNKQTVALIWAVASGLIYSIFTLVNRKLVSANHYLIITFYQHSTAALCVLPVVWILSAWPTIKEIWLLVILGAVLTALPQSLIVRSLATVKAQLASVIVGLEAVYAIIFAAILLNEIPPFYTIVGAVIVLFAVMLAMKFHIAARKSDAIPPS